VGEDLRALDEPWLRSEFARVCDRPKEVRRLERIGEAELQHLQHAGTRVKRHRAVDRLRHGPKLVDAGAMVAMRVRDDDAAKLPPLRCKKLLAKVGPAVDQDPLTGAFDEDRGPQASIARLLRVT